MEMSGIYLKQMLADARNYKIDFEMDFRKMTLRLNVDSISPSLLIDFLESMHRRDEKDRLAKCGITGALAITSRFKTTIDIAGVEYQFRVYELNNGGKPKLECELFHAEKEMTCH
jgi:hypothetical protein